MIHRFWVLPQGKLHCRRRFYHHVVHAHTPGFHSGKLTAYRVCAPRACQNRCHPCLHGVGKTAVLRVYGVYGTHLRRHRIGFFVSVVTLKAQRVLKHSQMAVRVYKPREKALAAGVNHFADVKSRRILPHVTYLVVIYHNAVFYRLTTHGVHNGILYFFHFCNHSFLLITKFITTDLYSGLQKQRQPRRLPRRSQSAAAACHAHLRRQKCPLHRSAFRSLSAQSRLG